MRPLQFAWHVQPLLAHSHRQGLKGCQMCGMAGDYPPRGVGMELLLQSKFTQKEPQWKAPGRLMSDMKLEQP